MTEHDLSEAPSTAADKAAATSGSTYAEPVWKDWLPAVCLAFAAFVFVTTELLPVGLLPDIAGSLNRSEASTGIMLTAYAWVVALMSLPLTVFSAGWDRRTLILGLLALFAASHILAACSYTFAMLMAARILIALCHALFWSIATPLAARVAPRGRRAQALSVMITGTSLATVLGIPLGTLLGHALGWRATFGVVAGLALVVFVLMRRLLPSEPSSNVGSFGSLPLLFHRKSLVVIYLLTLLAVTGHFIAFTYLAPYMNQIGGFSQERVAILLLCFGGAGIVGSILGGRYVDTRPRLVLVIPLALVCASLLGLPVVKDGLGAAAILCFVWGAALTAAAIVFQTRILTCAPEATDVAISLYSAIYNVGIGAGALLGSKVFQHLGLGLVGSVGAGFAALAVALALFAVMRREPLAC